MKIYTQCLVRQSDSQTVRQSDRPINLSFGIDFYNWQEYIHDG